MHAWLCRYHAATTARLFGAGGVGWGGWVCWGVVSRLSPAPERRVPPPASCPTRAGRPTDWLSGVPAVRGGGGAPPGQGPPAPGMRCRFEPVAPRIAFLSDFFFLIAFSFFSPTHVAERRMCMCPRSSGAAGGDEARKM